METANSHNLHTEIDNVKVAVRCRPLTRQEILQGHSSIVQVDEKAKTVSLLHPDNTNEPFKFYTFDELFGPDANQITVYNSLCRPIVENVLKGFNGTIFAYGQTGTGKTFTMSGDNAENATQGGVTQNSFAHIFDHIAKCRQDKKFLVRISYMEIYNEEVRDLLVKNPVQSLANSLEIKERADIGVYVKDLLNVTVANADQCLRIMHFGSSNRHTGKTQMNEQSSRSHAIFTITVECSEIVANGRQLLTQGKLHLVDLAGSERQSKTNAVGQQLKEASKINLSLSTLGNVISALVEKSPHIPYRNSKLTRILQDSLGGNSKTAMIANIGPASYNYDETVSTLRYANRAKQIRNVAHINEDPKDALLRRFQEEIEQLKRQLEETADATAISDEEESNKEVHVKDHAVAVARSEEKIREMEESIEKGKRKLHEEHGLKEGERRKLAEDLLRREEELKQNKKEREKLITKLAAIERQIIVGGENMLEKAELQAKLLEESNKDLEQAKKCEVALQARIRNQQAEQQDIGEQYSSLQEEAVGLGKKLKKMWTQYMQTKSELKDTEMEHQREVEALLESIRQLQRELLYSILVLDQFIPEEQLKYVEKFVYWNEEIGDWQLKCIAYTGNNTKDIRRANPDRSSSAHNKPHCSQMLPLFHSYTDFLGNSAASSLASSTNSNIALVGQSFRPKSAAKDRDAARIRAMLE